LPASAPPRYATSLLDSFARRDAGAGPLPLDGVRVLDLTDLAGALCARLLGDLGADVVRVEPPGGALVRRLPPLERGMAAASASHVHWFYDVNKRAVTIDVATGSGQADLRRLLAAADVVVTAKPPDLLRAAAIDRARLLESDPRLVLVDVTAFGGSGPRAGWRGSDLVCAARGGMLYVNGHAAAAPIAPFGLQAYNSAGVFAAIGTLCALLGRESTGRGGLVDVAIVQATLAAVEHVTGFYRQTGEIERRRGTLHWSRYFRIGRCRDGHVLHSTMGDWTTLAEWVAGDGFPFDLLDPRWEEPASRKEGCDHLFACLDRWCAAHTVAEIMEGAQLRRLPFAAVRHPQELATDAQLAARGFPVVLRTEAGQELPFPGPPFLLSATPLRLRHAPPGLAQQDAARANDPAWRGNAHDEATPRARAIGTPKPLAPPADAPSARVLDGTLVLDFTWVVAGPVATRLLADQGARVIKIERRDAADFGQRRGGLTGNLNRGKQSVVLNLADRRGLELVRGLARRADVVIDNFSARVMRNWGLDYEGLRALRPDVIAVAMSGFGLTGPSRDFVSYGPTLQALLGFPYLMQLPGGEAAGWGYSWSDMLGGMMAALATLAALWHRDRTGEGQLIDLGQYGNLAALLGPRSFALLRGQEVTAPGNGSQEGDAVPHGVYRCAAEVNAQGVADDDRWLAVAVLDDATWAALARVLAEDGEDWARSPALATLVGRSAAAGDVDARLTRWMRSRRAGALEERLQAAGVPAGLVANAADLVQDPQLAHRGYFATVPTPEGGQETFDGVPFVSSSLPGRVTAPGPLLGEHTDLVLHDLLGLGAGDIAALRAEGVIA
jgi:crotonobetainyl-CoA:carnitine CoA-transferase CaiB-like acyl-CoA transferase